MGKNWWSLNDIDSVAADHILTYMSSVTDTKRCFFINIANHTHTHTHTHTHIYIYIYIYIIDFPIYLNVWVPKSSVMWAIQISTKVICLLWRSVVWTSHNFSDKVMTRMVYQCATDSLEKHPSGLEFDFSFFFERLLSQGTEFGWKEEVMDSFIS